MSRRTLAIVGLVAALTFLQAAAQNKPEAPAPFDVRAHYTKYEYRIPMRDGVHLFTAVYVPKEASRPLSLSDQSNALQRRSLRRGQLPTCDSARLPSFDKAGYIFVLSGRSRPLHVGRQIRRNDAAHRPQKGRSKTSTTAPIIYDTIEWLLKTFPTITARPASGGFLIPASITSASMIDSHPALKAASPEAPMTNLFMGDDAYHGGAFMLAANFDFYAFFQAAGEARATQRRTSLRLRHAATGISSIWAWAHLRSYRIIWKARLSFVERSGEPRYLRPILEDSRTWLRT